MNHDGLLRAIREEPDEDVHRLVYADWLEEQGESGRAELIRLHLELMRTWPDHPGIVLYPWGAARMGTHERWSALEGRVTELALRHVGSARCRLRHCRLRGGLVEGVGRSFHYAEPVFRDHPVLHARLVRARGMGPTLAASPHVAALRQLELGEVDPADLHALADSSNLSRLRGLGLHSVRVPDLLALMTSPALPPVTRLALGATDSRPPAGTGLAVGAALRGEAVRLDQLRLLMEVPAFGRVRELYVFGIPVGNAGVRALAASPHLGELTHLSLGASDVGEAGVAALLASGRLGNLVFLNLWVNAVTDAGARALSNDPQLGNLRELNLSQNRITDEGAAALALSPHLGGLSLLSLSHNRIGKAGRAALVRRFGERVRL
jgi:uncharacterized protein (TIGR02996 family)